METDYGMLYIPKYEMKGLPGVIFEVKDASSVVATTITTDRNGVAENNDMMACSLIGIPLIAI